MIIKNCWSQNPRPVTRGNELNMEIVIPTYNRSAKLARTLKCYSQFGNGFQPQITILDGSDDEHRAANQQICGQYKNVKHIARPNTLLLPRMTWYLEQIQDQGNVCLGTDEDVFLPDYLENANRFLNENPDYAAYLGKYITFGKPLGPLRRMVHVRNVVNAYDINHEDYDHRIALLSYATSVGTTTVYWGVRRAKQMYFSMKQRGPLHFQTSQEIVDQILLAFMGKIKFTNEPMLLRDETRFEYVYEADREDTFNYFPQSEKEVVSQILRSAGGEKLLRSGSIYMDKFLLDYVPKGQISLSLQAGKKWYSSYEPIESSRPKWMSRLVFYIVKAAVIVSEVLPTRGDIRALKKRYNRSVINTFLRNVRSNQLGGV
jgi:glycosyltransferase domain-containing protein